MVANQGFINGLWYDKNGSSYATLQQLLDTGDLVKLALAGTLKDYSLVDSKGNLVKGAQLKYGGQPAGYTLNPPDVINYISAHDNQTLFDNNQYKIPMATTMADRVRVNNLGMALVGLAQGIPFFHAGDDILRSKSFDKNSFNSGDWFNKLDWTCDWFNKLDWTYQTNNYAVGLPQAGDNQGDWATWPRFWSTRRSSQDSLRFMRLISISRISSESANPVLSFGCRPGDEVKQRVKFYNTGTAQQPAFIVMAISDKLGRRLDRNVKSIVVLFNVDKTAKTITLSDYAGIPLELHPVLRNSIADLVVKQSQYHASTGTFTIPSRTTAVFLER